MQSEVFYDGLRRGAKPDEFWANILRVGIVVRRDLDDDFIRMAAQWKARGKFAYADAFALALAEREAGVLTTTMQNSMPSLPKESFASCGCDEFQGRLATRIASVNFLAAVFRDAFGRSRY